MDPATMMALASVGKGIIGIFQAAGEKAQADLDAFNIGTEKSLSRTAAMRDTRLRDESLREALSASDTFFFGVAGREETDDIRAMRKFEMEKSGEDISNIEFMARLNGLKYDQEAAAIKRKGKNTLLASVVDAAFSAGSAYADYKDVQSSKLMTQRSSWSRSSYSSPRPRLR